MRVALDLRLGVAQTLLSGTVTLLLKLLLLLLDHLLLLLHQGAIGMGGQERAAQQAQGEGDVSHGNVSVTAAPPVWSCLCASIINGAAGRVA
ncbi:hypothetical protein KB20921_32540 [Edwardsiella ictaluri]|nr:hypothetical protein KH20906_32440 [Edwardsiella ictaluri]BEI03993.1 hypothetical protein KB20921_32540 [Edwardsiella ictaluri]BEI14400.1 hypothetical protein STU22816_32530 [Edwardsiella ictaluri]